jgi:4-hydroxy-tetrahydrodipicolinate reductase
MTETNSGHAAAAKLALAGYGKMGRLLEQLAPEFGFEVALRLDEFNNVDGAGITPENFAGIGVAVDFSIPPVVADNVERIAPLGVNIVIGTTGWAADLPRVRKAVESAKIGLVYGANFSIGVLAFYGIVRAAAQTMLGQTDYDAWAYEVHHRMKKDAPSGTMLRLLEVMKEAGYGRNIDVGTNRAGTFPGTHEIGFDSEADTITLTHTARSRIGFARGALRAARWVRGRTGLHEFSSIWREVE